MFTKLRNKFLILCMAVTSLVLLAAFGAIYAVTYEGIQRTNMEKLSDTSLNPFLSGLPSLSQLLLPSDYRPTFTLLLDETGAVMDSYSMMDMSAEDYGEAAEKAWRKPNAGAPVRVNGRLWQYTFSVKGHYIIRSNQSVIEAAGYTVTFLDVTESHQTLSDLSLTFIKVGIGTLLVVFAVSLFFANRAVAPIKAAWEAQKRFIADASHELKTPLTIITSNWGALMSKKSETVESQMKWLANMKDGADRMNALIGDLLYLARAEGAEKGMEKAPNNIGQIVRDEIHAMEVAAKQRGLTVETAIQPDITMLCDGERLGQVVRILLDNAIKYADDDGIVRVALQHEKHQTALSVYNTGDGIDKEQLPRIFDRFYRTDTSRARHGGYGLGLSIAKAIVDAMGGRIGAVSEPGKSVTFTVTWARK